MSLNSDQKTQNNKRDGNAGVKYPSFPQYFRALAEKYGNMSPEAMFSAISRVATGNIMSYSPFIQNQRVKAIGGKIANHGREQVKDMLRSPAGNEQGLREVSNALEFSAYPYFKIRKTYQDLLTYRNYTYPAYAEKGDTQKEEFKREWRLVEKIRETINPSRIAHQIAGQCVRGGKVFYYVRTSVDKSHNKVNHAFLQQLPEDFVKIVGFNNVSKYTVAFNMMYFAQPGTVFSQFGDLFYPYMDAFYDVVTPKDKAVGSKLVYSSINQNGHVNMARYNELVQGGELAGSPEVYNANGTWFYWVTLPAEKIWTFEGDDVTPIVTPMLAGLMLSMDDIARYESVQLELVANPLVSLVTGEIPYRDDKVASTEDSYKLSPAGIDYFTAIFYNMLSENNTSGVGLYLAPAENIKLQQLSEAPNGGQVAADGYAYSIKKSGLSAILPITDEPRAGLANISLQLESKYMDRVYKTFEAMMNYLYSSLNLNWDWRFVMFGSLATDDAELEAMRKSMELGILPDLYRYNALLGRSILDDLSMSNVVDASGILDMRKPLITSYSAKQENSGLPPSAGGRPQTDGVSSEGKEEMEDAYGA